MKAKNDYDNWRSNHPIQDSNFNHMFLEATTVLTYEPPGLISEGKFTTWISASANSDQLVNLDNLLIFY
jgi:hypothetical protein